MKRVPPLVPLLGAVFALFIGILVFAYVQAKKANPAMIDEQGHVTYGS